LARTRLAFIVDNERAARTADSNAFVVFAPMSEATEEAKAHKSAASTHIETARWF
jgi:hypothetical protein